MTNSLLDCFYMGNGVAERLSKRAFPMVNAVPAGLTDGCVDKIHLPGVGLILPFPFYFENVWLVCPKGHSWRKRPPILRWPHNYYI